MNQTFKIIMVIGYIVTGQPMNEPSKPIDIPAPEVIQPVVLPEYEQEYCCSCYEAIPDQHSHFMYDPEHLVCIHCYFYRIPRPDLRSQERSEGVGGTDEALGLEYVSKNGMELRDK